MTIRGAGKIVQPVALPHRRGPDGDIEIALIATRRGTRWQLPKGTCEAGETAEQTAMREVLEEVGLRTIVEGYLRPIEYWYWDTYRKEMPELCRSASISTCCGLSGENCAVIHARWTAPPGSVLTTRRLCSPFPANKLSCTMLSQS
ncbi:MAG: NUDIX domain-containing protein [Anaerolineales bacterium]|nr:NUDIX domain-containing protein [Anaerolineales bacterium]